MSYKEFTEMPVWQKAFEMLIGVYKIIWVFPKEEKYGIVSNARRAANSVTNNLAEGFGRYEKRDKTRFYKIGRSSCYELINQFMVSQHLGYVKEKHKEIIISGYRDIITSLDQKIKTIDTGSRKKRYPP
jgi:four helix bundle protein